MIYYIYTLESNGTIFYIGKTKNIKTRMYCHINSSKLKRNYKERFMSKRIEEGEEIVMSIIDEVKKDSVDFWEQYWISQFKQWGFSLCNTTSGGDGGDYWSGKTHKKETTDKLRKIRSKVLLKINKDVLRITGEKNGRSKLKESQVIEIRNLREKGHSYNKLSMKFNISKTVVINIIKRKLWKHI